MTINYAESPLNGKYANMRRDALKASAPNYYKELVDNGTLEQHLINIQNSCTNYIERAVERFRETDEYHRAELESDTAAIALLNGVRISAESYIVREWIYNLDEQEESKDTEDYTDYDADTYVVE